MRFLFIRHGESVDNVAGVYAGSRDSPLTAHGVLQARRLAPHLAESVDAESPPLAHVFSSTLRRAVKTAQAICDAHNEERRGDGHHRLPVVQVPDLRERHFGSREGVSFRSGAAAPAAPETRTGHDGAETTVAMKRRADAFLDDYIVPLLSCDADEPVSCAVVAHGIILGVLFRALVDRLPRGTVALPVEQQRNGLVVDGAGDGAPPFVLPSWSNTGYLDFVVCSAPVPLTPCLDSSLPLLLSIRRVNCTDHLRGLRKTRGGIGSAAFDERQRTVDSFFSRPPPPPPP
ncbi:hypothetical protein JDV02_010271 [Purpureocillium takamizusanense]|uniref:Phosphoglycerate mutase family protein n=1 Tax=Purpureocillium takamizusanense TaxID=2060973 RepID=A0A9Q8QRH8_9HYPO|nr:uncharacterized protein JDV02_010271 [Purpureocillium takamizusanense]UNI24535.1 hypothetical protein JDV02_010271 [Purpureocillium takamizusanense]